MLYKGQMFNSSIFVFSGTDLTPILSFKIVNFDDEFVCMTFCDELTFLLPSPPRPPSILQSEGANCPICMRPKLRIAPPAHFMETPWAQHKLLLFI